MQIITVFHRGNTADPEGTSCRTLNTTMRFYFQLLVQIVRWPIVRVKDIETATLRKHRNFKSFRG
jgi:hypothetical protein